MELAKDLAGTWGMLADAGPSEGLGSSRDGDAWPSIVWAKGYLFARALTIGGGTAQVQRDIIATRVLGLPADVRE